MRKIETRLARIEEIMNRKAGPLVNFRLVWYGKNCCEIPIGWESGNVRMKLTQYGDIGQEVGSDLD